MLFTDASEFRFGGVKTDLNSRVLSTGGVPIPGLWAAGELTGLFYNEYPPATSCLRSMTFGRLAGAEIAQNLGKPRVQVGQRAVKDERSDSIMMMGKDVLIGEVQDLKV